MTTQFAIDLYNVLLDKYGSPSQEDDEIIGNLDMASYEYLNRLIPDNQGGIINFEFDSNVVHNLRPLIIPLNFNMDSNGLVSITDINTGLTGTGDGGARLLRVMSIGITNNEGVTRPVKYVFQNEIWAHERNFFKRPSDTNPKYTLLVDGLHFYPVNVTDELTIVAIKTPKALSLTGPINPEFDDYVMYNIISIALKLGGIQVRDEELLQDARLAALQISQ